MIWIWLIVWLIAGAPVITWINIWLVSLFVCILIDWGNAG